MARTHQYIIGLIPLLMAAALLLTPPSGASVARYRASGSNPNQYGVIRSECSACNYGSAYNSLEGMDMCYAECDCDYGSYQMIERFYGRSAGVLGAPRIIPCTAANWNDMNVGQEPDGDSSSQSDQQNAQLQAAQAAVDSAQGAYAGAAETFEGALASMAEAKVVRDEAKVVYVDAKEAYAQVKTEALAAKADAKEAKATLKAAQKALKAAQKKAK